MTLGTALRLAALALAALVVPACGGGGRSSSTLFNEGFNGSFPGTSWTPPVATGLASATIDSSTGHPAPSLEMTSPGPTAATVLTETVTSFNNPSLTISVHMAALSGGASEIGTGVVSIVDSTPAVVATATWDNAANTVTFSIPGGSADSVQPATRDGRFHRLEFNVDSSGTASWSFNNGAVLVTRAGFPPGVLKVRLSSSFGATAPLPSFFFDNVNVTSP